jgi:restriction endonuclease Mrr
VLQTFRGIAVCNIHWARFYLSKAGFLDSSTRGVWALARTVFRDVSATFAKSKADKSQVAAGKQMKRK